MKKYLPPLVLFFVLLPSTGYGWYNMERVAEKSFEQSTLYFESYYLNTYGMYRFGDVAPGLIDDPFLNLHVNPANLPRLKAGALLYFDFRGDRTEASIVQEYYIQPVFDYYYRPDPRWSMTSREEPEPVFSFGLLAYPFRDKLEKLLVGATYQIIYKEEPYYSVPSWIYKSYLGYDTFGERFIDDQVNVPVQERYVGQDELSTEAHLFSAFTGYPITDRLDLGVGINTVSHSREGSYINRHSGEYGSTDDWDSYRHEERGREQDYSHFDFNSGLRYTWSRRFSAGIKIGYLSGEADQNYYSADSSMYTRGDSLQDNNWNYHYNRSFDDQKWNRDGHTWYLGADFDRTIDRDQRIGGYYRYSSSDQDLSNTTTIRDTSYYRSHYVWSYSGITTVSDYRSMYATRDTRQGAGTREKRTHEGMLNLKWKVTRNSRVNLGLFFSRQKTNLFTSEPTEVDRWSDYFYSRVDTTTQTNTSYRRQYELKDLEWQYRSTYLTIQIPILLRQRLNDQFHLTLGVNRILEKWDISDQTVAYFTVREKTEDGTTESETNFAELYREPDQKVTEDYTAVLASLEFAVSPQFNIRLMVEPETEDDFKINQWWLSFQLRL